LSNNKALFYCHPVFPGKMKASDSLIAKLIHRKYISVKPGSSPAQNTEKGRLQAPFFCCSAKRGEVSPRPFEQPDRLLLHQILPDPFHRFHHILAVAEGGEAEETFTGRAETAAGSANHVTLVQELVEEVP
jgi:hypothetical protein